MKLKNVFSAVMLAAAISFGLSSCGPKDADIKTAIEGKIKASPELSGVAVDVKDGVATLSGEVMGENFKASAESTAKAEKGVKSVVNNITVAAPPPPPPPPPAPTSMTTMLDEATQQKVKDGLKDIQGVTVEFVEDKAVLAGEVTKANRMKIMQILQRANVKSDVSKLMDKK